MWFGAITSVRSTRCSTVLGRPSRQADRSRAAARRVHLEPLEDRRMLSFAPAVDYPVGTNPAAVASADFNSDGRLDLATSNMSTNDVSVTLGNANGTFQSATTSATGPSPLSLAVGDFNADGKLDIVTANTSDVSVLLGNGNGTFQPPTSINLGSNPSSVAVGDFNGDGKLDLGVTSNVYYPGGWGYYGQYPGNYVGRANVLLGDGGGAFSAPSVSTGYGFHSSMALADFNGDGKLDFATTSYDNGYVAVFTGTGTGTLGAANYFSTAYYYSRALAAGDVNGDGKPDLMAVGDFSNVSLLLGTGSFGAAQYFATGSQPRSVALGDFNSDGDLDIATANWGDSNLSVLLGNGAGSFKPPLTVLAGTGATGLALGDFNGDGRVDAATSNAGANSVSALLNDGIWPALDAPSISISDAVPVTEGNTGTVSAVFTVSLSAVYGQAVSVRYATSDGNATLGGGDYQSTSGTLTFTPGQTSKTVTVLVNGDRIEDPGETFYVKLTQPTGAFLGDALGVGSIVDDEPSISIVDYLSGPEGNSGTSAFSFAVVLSQAYDAPVTVEYATSDLTDDWIYYYGYSPATAGLDYAATSGTLTFAAGETSKSVTVLVTGDRIGEWDEYFLVNLSNPTSASLVYSQSLGHIVDDEPYVSINSNTSAAEGNAGSTPMTFSVTLSAAYDAPVTVSFNTADGSATAGSDYVATSGTLTFAPGQTSLPVTVAVKGDLLAEPEEYFYVQLSGATNGNVGNYNLAYGVILDDDTPPTISIGDASIVEGNSGTQLMIFTISLSQPSGKDVWVNYATANGTARTSDNDYTAKSGSVYFAPGETIKTIEIVVRGDTSKEKDERFYVNLSGAINGTIGDRQGAGTILNDDGGKGSGRGNNLLAFAFAVDAAIEDWGTGKPKKRR